jgi:hypothetical protein
MEALGCMIDLDEGICTFGCGWSTPIFGMLDDEDEYTEDPDEAVAVVVLMPEIGMWVYSVDDLDDLHEDEEQVH